MHGGEASSQVLQDSRAPLSSQGPQGFQSSPAGAEFAELNPGFPLLAIPGTAALRLNLELCRPRSKVWAGLPRAAAPSPCPATAPPPPDIGRAYWSPSDKAGPVLELLPGVI